MKKIIYLLIILSFFSFYSCNQNNDASLDVKDYENATKHFSKNLNKYFFDILNYQQWENEDFLFYGVKHEDKIENYQINLKTNKKSISKNKRTKSSPYSRRNGNEFLSPNGKLAAYIENYNLWVRNLSTNKKTQLTFDGKENYGYATNNAGWTKSKGPVLKWSPKSDKIATFRQDARGVGEMYLTTTNVGHPKLQAWKYALPGDDKIFEIERIIIDIKSNNIVRLNMKNDFQRSTTTDHIAGRGGELLDTQWNKDGSKLAFISSSRDHKEAHLQIADSKTGNVSSIFKENVETYYESGVRGENWEVLFDSDEYIWYSEKDNWGHLYLYDLKTKKLKNRITEGEWLVRELMHIDTEKRELIFTAGGKENGNPYHVYLYKVNFDGTGLQCLTPEKGTHKINPSPDWNYFVTTYSTTSNPPVSILKNRNGEKITELSSSNSSELERNGWQKPIEFSVKARDNKTDLFGIMYFHDAYYGNMGDNGLPDNITTIEQLSKKYKAMDLSRVGIWGHSGGGFASTAALLRYPDFYDVAVSSSGNHDNRNYEADWGEKWHGLLTPLNLNSSDGKTDFDSTKTNYDIQANQLLVENLKGKLLIAHGMLDDNVPPSNTMVVVDALIKANKDFDLLLFPNKRHGYGDLSNYMMRRKWDFFVKHLKGLDPPKNFSFKN